tara:strand:- start:340 stop:975 length:636 start_codon:yes stop_codon:yes gene_type:complete
MMQFQSVLYRYSEISKSGVRHVKADMNYPPNPELRDAVDRVREMVYGCMVNSPWENGVRDMLVFMVRPRREAVHVVPSFLALSSSNVTMAQSNLKTRSRRDGGDYRNDRPNTFSCNRCQSDEHLAKACPERPCTNCGGKGHYSRECPEQPMFCWMCELTLEEGLTHRPGPDCPKHDEYWANFNKRKGKGVKKVTWKEGTASASGATGGKRE